MKVFQPHGRPRVVLATNVAETSLTVPGIKYVIDPGTARLNRYSPNTRVQRLQIEPVSQASADQRKGRCGRVAEGVWLERLVRISTYANKDLFNGIELDTTKESSAFQRFTAGAGEEKLDQPKDAQPPRP